MTGLQDLAAVLRQMQRGSYTNDPNDPNYSNHWKQAESGRGVSAQSVPGVVVRQTPMGKVKQQVNIRYTEDQVFLDTPEVSAVGAPARAARLGLKAAGLSEPLALQRPANLSAFDLPFQLSSSQGQLEVRPNTAAYIGRPADLTAGQQVTNLWHLLRGK